jgi:hypothetical protein
MDNLNTHSATFVRADAMVDSLATLLSIVDLPEMDGTWSQALRAQG